MSGWNLTAGEAILSGGSGIKSMGWFGKATAKLGGAFLDSLLYTRMFPDGNASVARLLVRHLIPQAAPEATGPENIVAARFNYDALDREDHRVRLRLNSTVVGVRELGTSQCNHTSRYRFSSLSSPGALSLCPPNLASASSWYPRHRLLQH